MNAAICSVPVTFIALADKIDPQLKHPVLQTLQILQLFPINEHRAWSNKDIIKQAKLRLASFQSKEI